MSRQFINGQLAEKARLAAMLVSEILAEIPDEVLFEVQEDLNRGAKALLEVHHSLRVKDVS